MMLVPGKWFSRWAVIVTVSITGNLCASTDQDEDTLFRIWLAAFAEMTRGDQHEKDEHWPKAIEKYRISLRKFEALSADYPDYQSEIVSFRISALEESIDGMQSKLLEHFSESAPLFDKAVERIERSRRLEEAQLFEDAYRVVSRSIHQLKTLALENPEFYADMIAEKLTEAEEIAGRIKSHILTLADGKSVISQLERELARELPDLNDTSLPDRPDILMSPALFPSVNG